MKDFIKLTIIASFLLLTTVYGIDPDLKNEKIIQTIKLNSTVFCSFLNDYKADDYLYLSFDFQNYNKISMKNVVFFSMIGDQQYFPNSNLEKSITHSYINKEPSTISFSYITENEKKLNWKKSKIIYKESLTQALNLTKYYLEIDREKEDKNKKTLIIKIPILQKRGMHLIQHIFSLPKSFQKKEKDPAQKNVELPLIRIDNLNTDSKNQNQTINVPIVKRNYDNYSKYRDMAKNWKNARYKYYNKSNNYKNFRIEKNNWAFGFGGFLLFIWGPLFILYFLINRRKKSFNIEIQNSENNFYVYQNI